MATRLPAEERKKAVLDCACGIFSTGSYRGTTTAEIARVAGVTEPVLYRHFESKRDLYLSVLEESWRRLRELWVQALTEASDDPEIRKFLKRQMSDVHNYVADVIRRSQQAGGVLPDREASAEAWIFIAIGLLGTVGRRVGGLIQEDFPTIIAERRRWMTGIEDAPTPPAPPGI